MPVVASAFHQRCALPALALRANAAGTTSISSLQANLALLDAQRLSSLDNTVERARTR